MPAVCPGGGEGEILNFRIDWPIQFQLTYFDNIMLATLLELRFYMAYSTRVPIFLKKEIFSPFSQIRVNTNRIRTVSLRLHESYKMMDLR